MKAVLENKIINIDNNYFDNKFCFEIYDFSKGINSENVEIIFMKDLLKKRKNESILEKVKTYPSMRDSVFSPKDELEIFKNIFENAISKNKKTHIIGITLGEEVAILEDYYSKMGFFDEKNNCYKVDFSKVQFSASIDIKNIYRKGSDYKKFGEKIFFIPPIRESGQVKSLYKGINRGSIAGIYFENMEFDNENHEKINFIKFLENEMNVEHFLPTTLAKILNYNYEKIGIQGEKTKVVMEYNSEY